MPRHARIKSKTGIYHIMMLGINRQEIFHDDVDCKRYLETLYRVKEEQKAQVLGYCLMGNHLHLLVNEKDSAISNIIKRIGASYAYWYNWKYEHNGHVFQDRFKSENVEDDSYLLTVIRYIHQNPVTAGIVSKPEDYQWSSCREYYSLQKEEAGLIDTELILSRFSDEKEVAIEKFKKYSAETNTDECLEDRAKKRKNDEKALEEINEILNGKPITILMQLERSERDAILRKIKAKEGISLRQIARITGLSLNIIYQA